MMDWTEFIICNLYGIPLFILYIRIIHVLRTNRQIYTSAFYNFVVVSGIVDCCGYWLNQIFNRWPAAPLLGDALLFLFQTPTYYLTLPYMCTFYSMYLVHMSAFLLALNRVSSLLIPLSYEKVWRGHFHWLLLFYFAVPFIICFHLLASPTYVSTETPNHYFKYVQIFQGAFFGVGLHAYFSKITIPNMQNQG
ncbi:unnamed protein product [Bursaphelenchus xylophilus]|uniref:Serpentine receptor class gamma n=1 Tax=Bursaphelenchus xylophilus TaxID=6326 RepID=A0A1I7RTC2_BURXY|nr:unnamed protein product [Bursaphelenchus xylophilus]CAG9122506.1 unnamed protein product [Bursaphelenchus xylophilus]